MKRKLSSKRQSTVRVCERTSLLNHYEYSNSSVASGVKTGLSPTVIYYCPFQGDASVVVYFNCQCSSVFCLSLTYCSICLG